MNLRGVLNSTEWELHTVRNLQLGTGNNGTQAYFKAAVFNLKLNAVLIFTLSRAKIYRRVVNYTSI